MSSAGHVSDMNSRLRNNKELIKERKARQQKVLDACRLHPKHQAISDERKLSPEELERITFEIHQKAKNYQFRYWSFFFVIVLLLTFLIRLMFFLNNYHKTVV